MLPEYYELLLLKIAPYVFFTLALFQILYAVYLDLITAKFPNKFFLIYLGINLFLILIIRGFGGLGLSFVTMLAALVVLAPIYMVRMLGGGDIKLTFALSPLLMLNEFLGFLLMSFVWAGVFGLLRSFLGGNLRGLINNTLLVGRKLSLAHETIPFTVGILLGWLSYKSIMSLGLF